MNEYCHFEEHVVLENTFIFQLFYTPFWKNRMSKETDRPVDWDSEEYKSHVCSEVTVRKDNTSFASNLQFYYYRY